MTKPGDPQKGKAAEAEQIEQAAAESTEAVAQQESARAAAGPDPAVEASAASVGAESTESDATPQAEGTAAAKTGEQKAAAEAATRGSAAPRQRRRDENRAPAGTVVRAQAKYVRTSARKARLVCDHIRGKSVDEARAILAHTPRAVSEDWSKLLESAVANAEHNHELVGDDLRILQVTADEGPTLKRFRPRAMGRATKIRKRTSHLTILLTTKES